MSFHLLELIKWVFDIPNGNNTVFHLQPHLNFIMEPISIKSFPSFYKFGGNFVFLSKF